jgi:hypothetical protein
MGIPERIRQYRLRAEQKGSAKVATKELRTVPH